MKKNKQTKKGYRLFLILISLLLNALLYNLFLLPLKLVTGGTNGLATITHYLYNINPSHMVLLVSLSLIIIGYMYLGKEKTAGTLIACFLYPVFLELTSNIGNYIKIDTSDTLLLVLFSGVLSGIANGLMYKSGYSNGGFPIISQILYEKYKISIAKTNLVINIIIVLLGAVFFGWTNALYAMVFLYINSIIMDKVLLGISKNKAFYIITTKENEIKQYIIEVLNHTVTTFNVKGGFLSNKRRVLLAVVPTREYYKLTEGIKKIDSEAFFVVTDAYQVEGAK